MPLPSLATLAGRLSMADIEKLLAMKRVDPRLERLEAQRKRIAEQLADVDRRIAELAGDGAKAPKKRRGRKPGRPAKTAYAPAKRGRKPGRRAKGKPGRKPAKAGASRARLAALAKARAALAAKRRAAARRR
jgi:DNA-binding transcriptional MerR regulator